MRRGTVGHLKATPGHRVVGAYNSLYVDQVATADEAIARASRDGNVRDLCREIDARRLASQAELLSGLDPVLSDDGEDGVAKDRLPRAVDEPLDVEEFLIRVDGSFAKVFVKLKGEPAWSRVFQELTTDREEITREVTAAGIRQGIFYDEEGFTIPTPDPGVAAVRALRVMKFVGFDGCCLVDLHVQLANEDHFRVLMRACAVGIATVDCRLVASRLRDCEIFEVAGVGRSWETR